MLTDQCGVQNLALVEKVDELAKAKGVKPGQLALAWVHAQVLPRTQIYSLDFIVLFLFLMYIVILLYFNTFIVLLHAHGKSCPILC